MNYDLSVEELIQLVEQIKLTYNPLDDMFKIVKLGEIIYNTIKFQKWKICYNLYDSVVYVLEENLPNVEYSKPELQQIINDAREKNLSPEITKTTIINFIRDTYIKKTSFNYLYTTPDEISKGSEYLLFVTTLRHCIYLLYDSYAYEWNGISIKYDAIDELVEKKFSEMERQEEYITFIDKIIKVMDEVDILLKRFYKITPEYLFNGGIEIDYEMCFNTVIIKNNIDIHTEELLKSSIYKTNLELNKVNLNIKLSEHILDAHKDI